MPGSEYIVRVRGDRVIAGVDIGGTKVAVGIVDHHGRVLAKSECPTQANLGFPNAIQRITEMLRSCAREAGAEISGIGIGCTGPVYPFTGLIGDVDFLPGWKGKNPAKDLQDVFSTTAALENDADAAALGEAGWGAGKGKASLVYVTVGTGIGGGIILGGKLYRGVDQAHPEIGHHVIDPSGPQCFCGARGCWEVLARGPAMVEWMTNNAPKTYTLPGELTGERICELADSGDEWARRAVERESRYLGLGLANIVTLFAPETIVLGGSVMRSFRLFSDVIRSTVKKNCGLVPFEKTEFALASLGPDTALIGAARVWYHRYPTVGG